MKNSRMYSKFAKRNQVPKLVSLEEMEENIEQKARQEEADNIVLAEDKRVQN